MGILSQRTPPKKRRERSIFGSIFNALMLVVLVEVLLLVASIYLMQVGPQLNQNAEDILAMQVETRSGYIQSQLNDAQELSSLTSQINTLTQELLDSGAIDLATLDSSSDAAYPLLAAVTPKLISTLRSKSVTGIYLILNTHDLNERASGDRLPSVYLRDLDPDSPPPENNSDLTFERAPARLVQTQNIATDKAWKPAITYRSLGTGGLLYPAFQTAYDAETKLDATAYGHDWGDQYIRQTGQCFAANTPKGTVCSRLSGDEFLLLFYGYDSQDAIRKELSTLNGALRASCSTLPNGKTLNISISGGVAWFPEDGTDLKTLKKYADFAMYQVKQSHKGHTGDFDIGVYHREEYAAQTQREFEQLLREELVTYYFQPIFSAHSGRVAAYEALMRVNMPTITSPSQVMTLAHELDRLYDIERITLFKSGETYEQLQQKGLLQNGAFLFVNSIANVSLTPADVAKYQRRFPELLKYLVVEITEQEDLDRDSLERKRNVPGFSGSFALDDYGSGYSNELNLLALAPRYIKIDISIVRGIDTDRDKQQIVSNIVDYAHARSMQLIAEGIENDAELRKVIDLGVDLLQGFYLSRPAAVPAPLAQPALDTIRRIHTRNSSAG